MANICLELVDISLLIDYQVYFSMTGSGNDTVSLNACLQIVVSYLENKKLKMNQDKTELPIASGRNSRGCTAPERGDKQCGRASGSKSLFVSQSESKARNIFISFS